MRVARFCWRCLLRTCALMALMFLVTGFYGVAIAGWIYADIDSFNGAITQVVTLTDPISEQFLFAGLLPSRGG